jgi:WD40 repeat protein
VPNLVKAVVSKREIKLIPDIGVESSDETANGENEFEVTVVNESNKFASFYIELLAIGADSESNVKWYNLEPKVSAKKPPGDRTTFHVIITKPPIPVYGTTIELTLRVFSVEFPHLFTSQKINLIVEKARKPLRLYLPIKEFKVLPEEEIEIPVIVYNLSQKATDVQLKISGLNSEWITQGTEQILQIDAGDYQQTSFWCQPQKNTQALSQAYSFTIEAKSDTSSRNLREQGVLELLPQGTVEFICKNKLQRIPVVKVKGAKKQSKFATYELEFANNSNLPQQVNLQISAQDVQQCGLKIPEPIELAPGEIKLMYLVAKKRRPWWWLKRRLLFEVSPILTNPDTAEPDPQIRSNPSTQVLELQILPIIPFWLQLLGLLLLLLLLWLLWYLNPQDYHKGPVHSVRLIGNSSLVVSGSSDQTIRLWQVDRSPWQLDMRRLKYEGFIAEKTGKAVRVIRQSPREDYVIASGLESGDIKLWNVLTKTEPRSIYQGTDRVFALTFSKDSRYLFSGHGSGVVRQWNLEFANIKPQIARTGFTIYALSISESQQKQPNTLVAIAGRYNKLALWDWFNRRIYELEYFWQDWQEDKKFSPIMGQHQYIDSLAIADSQNLLASSDNKGHISLWDMDGIRQCINNTSTTVAKNSDRTKPKTDGFGNLIIPLDCDDAIIDQWQQGHNNQPVRSVALSQNGCYLASGGDDGRVVLWPLQNRKRSPQYQDGQIIAEFPGVRLNNVDIKALDDNLFITTGDDKNRVRLYRVKGINANDNANCQ